MSARVFRCRECGYPFKTAAEGWARNADLMCPACGSDDVTIVVEACRTPRGGLQHAGSEGSSARAGARSLSGAPAPRAYPASARLPSPVPAA